MVSAFFLRTGSTLSALPQQRPLVAVASMVVSGGLFLRVATTFQWTRILLPGIVDSTL